MTKPRPFNIGRKFLATLLSGGTFGNIPDAAATAANLSPIGDIPEVIKDFTPIGQIPEAIQTAAPIIKQATPIGLIPDVLPLTPLDDLMRVQKASEAARATALEGLLSGESPIQSVGREALPIAEGQNNLQFGDLLRERGITGLPAAIGGVALDVATDPLTYVFGGVAKQAAKTSALEKFLNPATVEEAIKTKPHSILSASLSTLSPEENAARTAQLADDLAKAGHTPIPIKENYGGAIEDSFLVPNMTKEEAIQLGQKYGQEAIITEKGAFFNTGEFSPKVGQTKVGNDIADNFSELTVGDKTIKFQHPIDFGVKTTPPKDVIGEVTEIAQDAVKSLKEKKPQGLVKEFVDAATGKGLYSDLPDEVVQLLRNTRGIEEFTVARSASFGNLLSNMLKATPELSQVADAALKGNISELNKLPSSMKNVVTYMRRTIDRASEDLVKELQNIAAELDDAILSRLAQNFGVQPGKRIPLPNLIETIRNNQGSYVKRMYQIFADPNYKPVESLIEKAKQGLMADFDISEDVATRKIEGLIRNKEIEIPFGRATLKVKQGSFIARQNIPDYIRDIMGEIKDPRYNYVQSMRNLAEAKRNFQLFRILKDLGYLGDESTNLLSKQIPAEGPLVWGLAHGQYTTPEIHDLLTHTVKVNNSADDRLLKVMTGVKFLKTVINPKTHGHNMLGNMFFGVLDDWMIPAGKNLKHFQEAQKALALGPKSKLYKELVQQTVIKNELPTSDEIKWIKEMIENPYSDKASFTTVKAAKNLKSGIVDTAKKAMDLYSWEDQIFKSAAYLRNKALGLTPQEAAAKVFESWPNYAEASRLAQTARSTGAGQLFANPFMTFRLESHRIMLNSIKDPTKRLRMAILLGGAGVANAAILAASGNSLSEVVETFQTKPEALSETIFNPASKDFDLNTRYTNPFNPKGLFAPLLALSGATGVNPFDYLLDFTQLSPDFGYNNLLTGAVEGLVTGRGKFGKPLSPAERVESLITGLGPTSFTRDLPKILNPEEETTERVRRGLRFLGIDVEQRNPNYIRNKVRTRLEEKVRAGEPVEDTMIALESLGFDSEKILGNVQKQIKKEAKSKKQKALNGAQNAYQKRA